MLAYLKFDEDRRLGAYLLALVIFLIGLMTKTAIVALPVVLLAVLWWKRGKLSWFKDVKPVTPFFGVALFFGLLTVWVERTFCVDHGETFLFSFIDRCLIAGRLFWFYLGSLFWPTDLVLIYPRWTINSDSWWQYAFPLAAFALFVGLWIVRDRSRGPLAAAICFTALLFPILGFFNLSYYMYSPAPSDHSAIFRADHFQYLADIAVIVPVCAGAALWWSRSATRSRILLSVCGLALLASLAGSTWAYSRNYQDSETCFRDVLLKNPNSATAHNNLGDALLAKGSIDDAIAHFERALEIEPTYQFGQYNLGAALAKKGDAAAAISHLKLALAANPEDFKSYYSLGTAFGQLGQADEAISSYVRAIELQPDLLEAHTNLANLLLDKGDIANALDHYQQALQLAPNSPMTHYN
jgi:tetratricopeptide (TPR) repeat protein